MSKLHLRAVEAALARKGWRVVAVYPGNDYDIAGTWEIRRNTSEPSLLIDFSGLRLDGEGCLPLEKSYGCALRNRTSIDLYFRRVNKRRELWEQDLAQFMRALDDERAPNNPLPQNRRKDDSSS